jgi:hypothetical protein
MVVLLLVMMVIAFSLSPPENNTIFPKKNFFQNIFCYMSRMIARQVKSFAWIAAKAEAVSISGQAAAKATPAPAPAPAPHLSAADAECDIDIDNI